MAIKRVNPNATYKLVSASDDAIDRDKSDMDKYSADLDVSALTFKEGSTPTFFVVKNLPVLKKLEMDDAHYKFMPPTVDGEGKKVKAHIEVVNRPAMLIKYFTQCVLRIEEGATVVEQGKIDLEEFSSTIIQEIGSYIMLLSTLGEVKKTTMAPSP